MPARKLTRGETVVIGIIAAELKRRPGDFDGETVVDGYRLAKLVKERLGCRTMLMAPEMRITDIAGAIEPADIERYRAKLAEEKGVTLK